MLSGRTSRYVKCPTSLRRPRYVPRTSSSGLLLLRNFQSSRPNQLFVEIIEPITETVHAGFQTLHTQTGLPWYLTIPLGAVLLRMIWIPVQVWQLRGRKPRETLIQLTSAWRRVYQDTARIKFPSGSEADAKQSEAWVRGQLKAKRKDLKKHIKYTPPWVDIMLGISFIPLWISSADCLRRMSGDTRTIASLFAGPGAEASAMASDRIPIEPGFAIESLFWIPSLTSADPQWILPMTFGMIATWAAWLRVRDAFKPQPNSLDMLRLVRVRVSRILGLLMLGAPSYFTYIMIRSDLATAVVLYVIGTTITTAIQRPLVARLVGSAKRIQPLYAKMAKPKGQQEN